MPPFRKSTKKFYVVWKGVETGIFTSWKDCEAQVKGFPSAQYKGYSSRADAEAAWAAGSRAQAARAAPPSKPSKTPRPASRQPAPARAGAPADAPETQAYDVEIYCDGACDPNPGHAGTGMAVYRDGVLSELWYGLYNPQGTNNSAELNGLFQALVLADEAIGAGQRVRIWCDSRYSIDCVTRWSANWKRNGWKRKGNQPIQNLAIIQQCHALHEPLKQAVTISHVRGHQGVEGNELADRMAMFGAHQQETDFSRYPTPYTIPEILALKAG